MTMAKSKRFLDYAVLALLVLMIAYNALAFGGVRLIDQAASMWLMAPALALFGVRILTSGEAPRTGGIVGCMVVLFFAYAWIRHQFAETEYSSRHGLIDVGLGTATFFLALNVIPGPRHVRWAVFAMLAVAVGLSILGAYQFATGSDHVWSATRPSAYHGRGSGTFINPNHLAGFLELILPLGLFATMNARRSWALRIICAYCVLVIIAGIALTFSRGGWLATGAALFVFLGWLLWSRRRMLGWALLVMLVVGVIALALFSSQMSEVRVAQTEKELAAGWRSTRLLIWQAAYDAWQTNPWWGIGAEQFKYRYHAFRDPWLQTNPVRVHNDYLDLLCEYGVAG
ncbi:MAG TPA: hypothetical protein DCY13_17190, partial [Verrucomicrobiales bacterium]|nr:hypothetical protein [Verrucomicrobiales bacterium]